LPLQSFESFDCSFSEELLLLWRLGVGVFVCSNEVKCYLCHVVPVNIEQPEEVAKVQKYNVSFYSDLLHGSSHLVVIFKLLVLIDRQEIYGKVSQKLDDVECHDRPDLANVVQSISRKQKHHEAFEDNDLHSHQ